MSTVVRINYYPPRNDNKEGWDNIDIFGWMGYPMQIKINFLCRECTTIQMFKFGLLPRAVLVDRFVSLVTAHFADSVLQHCVLLEEKQTARNQ